MAADFGGKCEHCGKVRNTYSYEVYCSYTCQQDAIRKCEICYKPYSRRESGKFGVCSDECSSVRYRRDHYSPKACGYCGKELPYDHPLTDYYDAGVFYACSDSCKNQYFYENPPNREAWKS